MTLDDLKVGDEVCIVQRAGWRTHIVGLVRGTVEKVTATQITALGCRWNKRTGCQIGGDKWVVIVPVTPELEAEAREGAAIAKAESDLLRLAYWFRRLRDEEALRVVQMVPQSLLKEAPE